MARYVACSCNRAPHCADWGRNGLVCFGTCNAIAIYEPCTCTRTCVGRVLRTLHRHHDRVTTVRWIGRPGALRESELLSGSVDGTVIVWSEEDRDRGKVGAFRDTAVLDARGTVTFVDSLQLSDDVRAPPAADSAPPRLLICAGTTDGELRLWSRERNADTKVIQTILFGRRLPIHCRLAYLPDAERPLLAVALEDASVLLYVADRDANSPEPNFVKVQSLHGHEDWIRCMDLGRDGEGGVLLATGSQDTTIRLWRIGGVAAASSSSDDELVQKGRIFTVDDRDYSVTLESVLSGHEGWVYGVHWQSVGCENGDGRRSMRLLSSSLDKSMIIWQMDDATGIWTEKVRVGEVGGNSLGFYGCKFGPDGLHILAHGYQGSFHIWKYSQSVANWIPLSAPGGHYSEVVDLCWEPRGRFLVTASTDQTTRIHAPWKDDLKELWHEIARPQVHGYDMTCLVMLTPYMFASGAEEKVARVFAATSAFRDRLRRLTPADMEDFESVVARGATVPSLGLTNKATFDERDERDDRVNGESPTTADHDHAYEPPTEEELAQNTLWPESHKLYGHGYEIFCMAARHDGRRLATACKSTSPEHSAIILWSTDAWSQVQKLVSHQLTVTQMEFSPNDRYLLSVSRDRRWSLFREEDAGSYALIAASTKKDALHSRIIWCCAWTRDSSYFVTGSRDGKIGVWSVRTIEDKGIVPETCLDTRNQSVTAMCFANASRIADGSYVLAIGYETGRIEVQVLTTKAENAVWSKLAEYDTSRAHHLTVKRLMFRPGDEHLSDTLQLASCGSDHAVKIHDIDLSSLSINV